MYHQAQSARASRSQGGVTPKIKDVNPLHVRSMLKHWCNLDVYKFKAPQLELQDINNNGFQATKVGWS